LSITNNRHHLLDANEKAGIEERKRPSREGGGTLMRKVFYKTLRAFIWEGGNIWWGIIWESGRGGNAKSLCGRIRDFGRDNAEVRGGKKEE